MSQRQVCTHQYSHPNQKFGICPTPVRKFIGTQRFLPVTVSLLAPRGMDSYLLGLLSELQTTGVLRPVACGPHLFPDD
ncbi:hypothetical protein F5Y18DRAFT_390258 [Xylariaceae sp. FL1019]|nr:hypothetical protein F5Y18DRAFT_390258 [Xylariaceae sp. FL1019]